MVGLRMGGKSRLFELRWSDADAEWDIAHWTEGVAIIARDVMTYYLLT